MKNILHNNLFCNKEKKSLMKKCQRLVGFSKFENKHPKSEMRLRLVISAHTRAQQYKSKITMKSM